MALIFSEYQISQTRIKNRLVLPPMVTFNFSEKGFVNDKKINHYRQIAENGIGLIVVEATAINPQGRLSNCQLGIWDDQFIPGFKRLTEVIRQAGSVAVLQIHHAGSKAKFDGANDIVSASDSHQTRGLTETEVYHVIDDFKMAALRAYQAGFDGVEIHGAHGYLLTQFFSMKTNHRKDQFGGSFENRMRIATNVYQEVRKMTSPEFIVGMRMGCNENSIEESIHMAQYFEQLGYDYLSVSSGLDGEPIEKPDDFPYHWITYGGTVIKRNVQIPVIGVYGIRNQEQIEGLLNDDLLDFVAIGKGQLADYQFTKHLKNGSDILYCLECNPCQWRYSGDLCPRQIQAKKNK